MLFFFYYVICNRLPAICKKKLYDYTYKISPLLVRDVF